MEFRNYVVCETEIQRLTGCGYSVLSGGTGGKKSYIVGRKQMAACRCPRNNPAPVWRAEEPVSVQITIGSRVH